MRELIIIIINILFFLQIIVAQPTTYTTKKTTSAKAKKYFDAGNELFAEGKLERALRVYNDAIKADPAFIDAQIQWAAVQQELKNTDNAITGFERALTTAPGYEPKIYYVLAGLHSEKQQYDEAIKNYDRYLKFDNIHPDLRRKATLQKGNAAFAAEATKHPVPFEPKNLGAAINTGYPDYLPTLTADGKMLIYVIRIEGQEDFYFSIKENDTWTEGQPLTALNTPNNEASQSISADGKTLYYTICYRQDSYGGCDIYFSERNGDSWAAPKNLGNKINTSAWDTQPSLSADGNKLYFVSNRSGGFGGSDIWVSNKAVDGTWQTPINLGATINTTYDEISPFIHQDNQTLYFSSEGHPGMGDQDIFFSRRLQKDTAWTTPTNLGYPINTIAHEGSFIVSLDGKTGYYTSSRDNKPNEKIQTDLFSFELPVQDRPIASTYVKATVVDAVTGKKITAKLQYNNLTDKQFFSMLNTDNDGESLACLPTGKDYSLSVTKEGYTFYSENFALTEIKNADKPFVLKIELQPLATASTNTVTAKPIVLKNVFFEIGSAKLRSESQPELEQLRKLLSDNVGIKIQINGHTDNVGNDTDNQTLSENRAKAVYDFLIQKGISAARLSYKGFGESQPIDTNDSPDGRANNRRTEFQIE